MNKTSATQLKITFENAVTQNVLGLLSASLNDNGNPFLLDLNLWPEIKEELKLQAVFPLVSVVKIIPRLSDCDQKELSTGTAINIRMFHELMQVQTAVISLLNTKNIPVAIMKGASAGQYYKKPELRMYGDIDIIVPPDDFRKAYDLLCGSGYQNLQAYDASDNRHIGFTTPEGKHIELHRYFSSSNNEKENDLFDGWLYENIKNIEHVNLDRYGVPVFPALENGLILLGHINQHLCDGLGLRQIIDWMLFVRAELTDDFWKEKFRERAEAIGMDCLAKTVTKMCEKHLGLNADITWCEGADDELADELMLYILNNGNFGWKTNTDLHKSASIVRQLTNPAKAFRYLTNTGSIHMTEAGMKPRKLFAWLYQIGHLFLKFANSKNKRDILKGIKCSTQQTDLMRRLRVTRI